MQRFFGLANFPPALRGAVLALGNFDGVHQGHAWVLKVARRLGAPLVVLTFEPHPRAVLVPGTPPFRLTPGAAKLDALNDLGVSACVTLAFDKNLAATPAEAFVADVLGEALTPRHVVVGHDYAFGRNRTGDVALLEKMGRRYGFSLIAAPPAATTSGERVSSSLIRSHLRSGRVCEAAKLLGRDWTVTGRLHVEGPDKAFIDLRDYLRPASGAYAVDLASETGARAAAVAIRDERRPDQLIVQASDIGFMDGRNVEIRFVDLLESTENLTRSIAAVRHAAPDRYQISCT
jgi:riboflavin kinase/FMN adenylyltransferase